MLVGRTFSYSDTQRHRVGPNYLQLPVNQPEKPVATNQADGQMAYGVDNRGDNPHVNYEPSIRAGLTEADESYHSYEPHVTGNVVKAPIDRENNFQQAGERYRTIEQWERDDLVLNLVSALAQCDEIVQETMVSHLRKCDDEFGQRVADGLKITTEVAR
jgi:catalase